MNSYYEKLACYKLPLFPRQFKVSFAQRDTVIELSNKPFVK